MEEFDLLSQPSTTDLFGQPSTEQVLMGARARGQSATTRDPRAVVEFDDVCFDPGFDPNLPSTSISSKTAASVSASGISKAAATGIDVVDDSELKRRIRGSGSAPQVFDRLKLQASEAGAKFKAFVTQHANAHPRVALGVVAILVLVAMYWSIWLIATREEAAVDARHSTSRPPQPDVVDVAALGSDTGTSGPSDAGDVQVVGMGESGDEQTTGSKSLDLKDSLVKALTRSNNGLKTELANLRKDVQEVKEMLKSSLRQASAGASVRKQAPKRTEAATTPEPTTPAPKPEAPAEAPVVEQEEDGEGEVRTEVRAESKTQPESTPQRSAAAAEPASGDPGEIRIEKPRSMPASPSGRQQASAKASSSQSADGATAPSAGWGQFFAR
eukprot:TRINITY_DN60444_c0_g1_i1.p1 TRINITY_DN60444_c0_g1~~TRINITY_DN60444_c0_g1_i1.p1  ORF type:complete len:385 (+),score=82.54 TRINITY_DN60444_c0_g1_i1:103-1257(+)